MTSLPRKTSIALACVLLALTTVELACAVLFNLFAWRFTFFDPKAFTSDPRQLAHMRRSYDRELGWMHHFDTPLGERPRPIVYGHALLASFGDSFTYGDEVGPDATWQTALARQVQADIYNFGVEAYGTDQAYLRFRRDFPRVNTPLVTLGLLTENINRAMGIYRKFYFSRTRMALTKPRFELIDGQLHLLPNPIVGVEQLEQLSDQKFIANIGRDDWWYNRDNYPELSFPYIAILFNRRLWLEALYGRGDSRIDDILPRPWEDLWQQAEPRALMEAIFASFAIEAKARRAQPIVMLFPQRDEILGALDQRENAALRQWKEICRKLDLLCFDGITALASTVHSRDELPLLYGGSHLSPLGNRRIAECFYRFLRDNRLLPDADAQTG